MPDPKVQALVDKLIAQGESDDVILEVLKQTAASAPPTAPPPASRLSQVRDVGVALLNAPSDLAIGAVKGAASTAYGLGKLMHDYTPVGRVSDVIQPGAFTTPPPELEAHGAAQQVGKTSEQIAEFFLPAAKIAKVKTALKIGTGVLDAVVGAGVDATAAAAVDAAQRGTPHGTGTTAAIAAVTPLAVRPLGVGTGWLGERIEKALLKPTKAASEGLTPSQLVAKIYQHNVGGTLSQTFDKTNAAITQKSRQLASMLKAQPTTVDVAKAFIDTADDIQRGSMRTVGSNEELARALDKVSREVSAVIPVNGHVNLVDANEIKRGIGDLGAWTRNPGTGQMQVDTDANALSDVADRMYGKLKTAIENAAPKGSVRALNQALSDLITIRRAVVHRIPVAERANMLNMGDLLGLSSGTFWVSVANRLLQSGRVANIAVKAGQAAPAVAQTAGKLAAGSAAQVGQ